MTFLIFLWEGKSDELQVLKVYMMKYSDWPLSCAIRREGSVIMRDYLVLFVVIKHWVEDETDTNYKIWTEILALLVKSSLWK